MKNLRLNEIVDRNKSGMRARKQRDKIVESVIGTLDGPLVLAADLPVSPSTSQWDTLSDPERLVRTFHFDEFHQLRFFINEMLLFQEEIQHHATITISHRSVIVETYTHDLNLITETDQKLSKYCDELYEDAFYISSLTNKSYDNNAAR